MSDSDISAMAWWDRLLEDAADQRAAYEDDGWEAFVLHTADVTPLDGTADDRVGLSVLVPDDEFDRLAGVLSETTVQRYDAFRTTVTGYVAFVLAIETADDTAVLCPGYYVVDDDSAEALFEQALADEVLTMYVRRLDGTSVEVELADPELLEPPKS
jgi:hypothetical protein